MLLAEVLIDQVLLGHKNVKITEKYYAPCRKARQSTHGKRPPRMGSPQRFQGGCEAEPAAGSYANCIVLSGTILVETETKRLD
jgi:hypothetical protein